MRKFYKASLPRCENPVTHLFNTVSTTKKKEDSHELRIESNILRIFYESNYYIIRKLRIEFESSQSSIRFGSFGALVRRDRKKNHELNTPELSQIYCCQTQFDNLKWLGRKNSVTVK
jgi:hypothetical protein